MKQPLFHPRLRHLSGVVLALGPLASGCGPAAPTEVSKEKDSPAKVAKIANEGDLNTIKLTAEAEKHLALAVAPVEFKPMPRVSTYGGEIMLPQGAALTISAPFTGTLEAPA